MACLRLDAQDRVVLDHRIREQLPGEFLEQAARLGLGSRRELDLEQLALAHVLDRGVAELTARRADRLALRIEHVGLELHLDQRLHESSSSDASASVRSKIASTWRSASSRLNARSISSFASTRVISESASTRSRKSPPWSQVSIACFCTRA